MFPCATKRCEYRIIVCFFEQVLSVNRGINRREKKKPDRFVISPPMCPSAAGTWREAGMNGHSSECSRVNPKILLTDLHAALAPQRQREEAWLWRERRGAAPLPSTAPPGRGNCAHKTRQPTNSQEDNFPHAGEKEKSQFCVSPCPSPSLFLSLSLSLCLACGAATLDTLSEADVGLTR